MSEPKGELARYAFGYSDKKPGWLFWLIHLAMISFIVWAIFHEVAEAATCHHYSVWKYPYPQPRCGLAARGTDPNDKSWYVEITKMPPLEPAGDRDKAMDQLKEMLK